ncbi:type II 3-dehydroquinate dehydratase [Oscillibacter sp. MSJ-2]|uniref:3-dehydroquinate dehydratase n=1 Tax=Dysosmobacter acutus TaxID=2841504 RepID=A0ABS6F8H3_9FIRM|nr:type II 3-dehydroquinate dehydratase [Dysosmobacter acutus]MBU5625882.1 type II 3-dehydroquinate dehydratase [Dysosmobacter acutus]
MKIMVLNGPNLNMLGIREPGIYGSVSYEGLLKLIADYAAAHGHELILRQSNHEGDLVDWIQEAYGKCDGIVINPGAYTHTSVALLDAVKAVNLPTVEVHISDVDSREPFRQVSYISLGCVRTIKGMGLEGYLEAIRTLEQRGGAQ